MLLNQRDSTFALPLSMNAPTTTWKSKRQVHENESAQKPKGLAMTNPSENNLGGLFYPITPYPPFLSLDESFPQVNVPQLVELPHTIDSILACHYNSCPIHRGLPSTNETRITSLSTDASQGDNNNGQCPDQSNKSRCSSSAGRTLSLTSKILAEIPLGPSMLDTYLQIDLRLERLALSLRGYDNNLLVDPTLANT